MERGSGASPSNEDVAPVVLDEELKACLQRLEQVQEELRLIRLKRGEQVHVVVRRNMLIRAIPEFWHVVFSGHATLGPKLTQQDHEILKYVDYLNVMPYYDERGGIRGLRITIGFNSNPYFRNTVLSRSICPITASGTAINWYEAKNPGEGEEGNESFFEWFNVVSSKFDVISKIIIFDFWVDPLKNLDHARLAEVWRIHKESSRAVEQSSVSTIAHLEPLPLHVIEERLRRSYLDEVGTSYQCEDRSSSARRGRRRGR